MMEDGVTRPCRQNSSRNAASPGTLPHCRAPTQTRRMRLWSLARRGLRIAADGGCDSHREAAAVSARPEAPWDEACRDHIVVGAAAGVAVQSGGGLPSTANGRKCCH